MFKMKDGYKLELQTPETMKLFGSKKKINGQNKKTAQQEKQEIAPRLEVVKVALAQCSFVDNEYQ